VAGGPLNLLTAPYAETVGMLLNIEAGAQGYRIFSSLAEARSQPGDASISR